MEIRKGVIVIKTYQDLLAVGEDESKRIDFVFSCINQHKGSKYYKIAEIADDYDRQQNTTIVNFQKTITDITGQIVPDKYSASYKMCSNFYNKLTEQRVQYSLSNGVKWSGTTVVVPENTPGAVKKTIFDKVSDGSVSYHEEWQLSSPTGIADKLGKDFDTKLQELCKAGLDGGTSFGFFNLDHMEVFKITEFVPLYDENNGSLRAGIRWVQIDGQKPMVATLYEEDGYTEYIWYKRVENDQYIYEGQIYKEKRKYIEKVVVSGIDEGKIYNGENYPSFPIVPFFANRHKQSAIVGMREDIDAYDFNKNGYANALDNALVYWVLKGAAGFDDIEASDFIRKLKQSGVVNLDSDQDVQAIDVNPSIDGRERLLDRIEKDIYKNFNAFDVDQVKSGAVTATQIKAAYEPIDMAANQFEYQIIEFLSRLMKVVGIEDTPTFTRAPLVSAPENINMLIQSAQYLTDDYVTTKILELFGDGDKADVIINQKMLEEAKRYLDSVVDDEEEQAIEGEEEKEKNKEGEEQGGD